MSNRPAIPADIQRQILWESGHRCAVCGTPCPLEQAHIIPWHRSREHKVEDLICLCANCHARADKEQWGEKTLREYKEKPWVSRWHQTEVPEVDLDKLMPAKVQQRATDGETTVSSPASTSNPFIYGRPVRPEEFVDREDDLRTIFNRLHHCESTAVVGEPHIGKSSLLLKLADEATQRHYLPDHVQGLMVSHLDLYYSPTAFWQQALKPLRERPGQDAVAQWLKQIAQADYNGDSLREIFGYLQEQGQQLVLLLDEFDLLLDHSNFQDFAFFATLRALSSLRSFSFVTASRLSLKELNQRGYSLPNSGGSPLFNTLIEVRLRPFDEEAVEVLLRQTGDDLSPDDRRFIRRMAGRHPFLIQAMAAALIETTGDNRQICASERFYERISYHFDDLWHTLDDRTRTAAVILSLVELRGRALGQSFAYGQIERANAFGPELQKLARHGLAERVSGGSQFDWDHLLVWQGERWKVGSEAFISWVSDVVIAGTRQVPAYDEWLENKRYRLLLTQEQWDRLVGAVRSAPEWMVRGVGSLARALLEELMRREQR
jgi:hypothetical protein